MDMRRYDSDMRIKINDLELTSSQALQQTIVGLAETLLFDHFYSNSPNPTEDSARNRLRTYRDLLEGIVLQLSPSISSEKKLGVGIKKLAEYIGLTLESPVMLARLNEISKGTIQELSKIYPDSKTKMKKFLETLRRSREDESRRFF